MHYFSQSTRINSCSLAYTKRIFLSVGVLGVLKFFFSFLRWCLEGELSRLHIYTKTHEVFLTRFFGCRSIIQQRDKGKECMVTTG